jgi:hypothetical protein
VGFQVFFKQKKLNFRLKGFFFQFKPDLQQPLLECPSLAFLLLVACPDLLLSL